MPVSCICGSILKIAGHAVYVEFQNPKALTGQTIWSVTSASRARTSDLFSADSHSEPCSDRELNSRKDRVYFIKWADVWRHVQTSFCSAEEYHQVTPEGLPLFLEGKIGD